MERKRAPVHKNEILTLAFEDLSRECNGVWKVEGYSLFVTYVLQGETAKIKVVRENRNFGYGKLREVTEKSDERVEPPCNVFYRCGGCQIQHMSYDLQLEMKRKQVENAFSKIAHLEDVKIHDVRSEEQRVG